MINLDTTIAEYFGVKKLAGRKFGIELEYEDTNYDLLTEAKSGLSRWTLTKDDSLRNNGIEFVSRPTAENMLEVAITQALDAAKLLKVRATHRCGLHVHVNMTDQTFRELFNVSVLYTLLEPTIFAEYCEGRQESHFCVPTYCNTILADNMLTDVQKLRRGIALPQAAKPKKAGMPKKKPLSPYQKQKLAAAKQKLAGGSFQQFVNNPAGLPHQAIPKYKGLSPGDIWIEANAGVNEVHQSEYAPDDEWLHDEPPPSNSVAPVHMHPPPLRFYNMPKYGALNYSALTKFGTIEYRQHPSTLSKNRLLEWVLLIAHIHEYASLFADPLDIIQLYDDDGLFTLCEKVGLKQTKEVDSFDLEDAVDAATMIAGYHPVTWQSLQWEIA